MKLDKEIELLKEKVKLLERIQELENQLATKTQYPWTQPGTLPWYQQPLIISSGYTTDHSITLHNTKELDGTTTSNIDYRKFNQATDINFNKNVTKCL